MRPGRASLSAAVLAILLATGACGGDGGTGPESGVEPLRNRIVFASNRGGGELQFYAINPDGTGLEQLTSDPERRNLASVSPDGKRIAYASGTPGRTGMYVLNVDGTGETLVLNHGSEPVWSPDGSRIAFRSRYSGSLPEHDDIWVVDADGSNPVNLGDVTGAHSWRDLEPAWSPDGRQIAYASERSGQSEIWIMNADGSDPVQVTTSGASASRPAWSPDGGHIAYTVGDLIQSDIYVKDLSGGPGAWATTPAQNLTNLPSAQNSYANWSPDGTTIAFVTYRTGDFEIFLMDSDGANARNLTNSPATAEIPGPGQAWAP